MNNRDPFSLRRTSPALSLLQSPSPRADRIAVDSVESSGDSRGSSSMAALPNGAVHRYHSGGQSQYAPPSLHGAGGMGEALGGIFGEKEALPMYKDKPYNYPGSRRYGPWYKRKRTVGLMLGGLAFAAWWFGVFSSPPSSEFKKQSSNVASWFSTGRGKVDWDERADRVREVFRQSFSDYEKHAWGYDEYHPVSKTSKQMVPNGMGWIIVDALDTMMIMNLTSELTHARQWVHDTLTYDQDHDVNTFETTIRMLGGLLSAHYLSNLPGAPFAQVDDGLSDDMYIEKATDLADRLSSAYQSNSGVPFASVNLHQMKGLPSHADGGASSTAEATTLQLEMKYLSKLTGEDHYWDIAEHVMSVIDDQNAKDGLVPIFIYADSGKYRGDYIRLGSRGDSYYEYLIKQYLQTSQQEPVYQAMWNESLAGVKKHLLTYSSPSNFTVLAERPSGLHNSLMPKMDHLVCFMPGTIALATTGGKTLQEARKSPQWGPRQEEDMQLARELMKTCWGMYAVTPTGLAGEITHFKIHEPPLMYEDFPTDRKPHSPDDFEPPRTSSETEGGDDDESVGHEDYVIKSNDRHNLQRPETLESLFYMWRITGDVKYREWGWKMFESFTKYTIVEDGPAYSSVQNVMSIPPPSRDNMESFWLAETLKYFYLLFTKTDVLPLTDVVFNTEAHPFPRFELGKLFKTGWERKPRDSNGDIITETRHTARNPPPTEIQAPPTSGPPMKDATSP